MDLRHEQIIIKTKGISKPSIKHQIRQFLFHSFDSNVEPMPPSNEAYEDSNRIEFRLDKADFHYSKDPIDLEPHPS